MSISTRWSTPVIKVGVVYIGVHISRYLKESWLRAIDKWLWVIARRAMYLLSCLIRYIVESVPMTHTNSKAMPINDNDYSCHIKAVKLF